MVATEKAMIKKVPDLSWGAETGEVEYVFDCIKVRISASPMDLTDDVKDLVGIIK
jgi:hypothetical protein